MSDGDPLLLLLVLELLLLLPGGVLFSDSNGREMLLRKRDHRPSWTLQVWVFTQ
jgi:hypothetical protein